MRVVRRPPSGRARAHPTGDAAALAAPRHARALRRRAAQEKLAPGRARAGPGRERRIQVGTRIEPPALGPQGGEPAVGADGTRRLDGGAVRRRGKVLEVRLAGTPEAIGHQHGRLLHPEMVDNEGKLLAEFRHYVPFAPARWLIMDMSRLQFRSVDQGMSDARRHEVAAQARAFSPDPYAEVLPTYHRFVFLQSLYDIALSFEHSPLIGCTSFTLGGEARPRAHHLARNSTSGGWQGRCSTRARRCSVREEAHPYAPCRRASWAR